MFGWGKSKDVRLIVNEKRKVRVCGTDFIIKRLDVMTHLEGINALQKVFDTYQLKDQSKPLKADALPDMKKLRAHYTDIICAGVVSPKIGRKDGEGVIQIEDVFTNWELANALYNHILEFSYGEKKKRK